MIFHLTTPALWSAARRAGEYTQSTRDRTLADEGFIHCSTAEQWPGVRRAFFTDVEPLLLLHIDESRLDAELRYDPVPGAPAPFPHLYGPLNLDAVVQVEQLGAGSFHVAH